MSTGSVALSDLPKKGSWVLTRTPGGVKTVGHGTGITITGLLQGTYFYTVTDETGSTSGPSSDIIINNQPASPSVTIQAIDC